MAIIKKVRQKEALLLLVFGALALSYFITPGIFAINYSAEFQSEASLERSPKKITHIKTPAEVKAIYMSQCVVGTKNFRDDLVKIVETTEINSLVIDIKDFSGGIGFKTENPALAPAISQRCYADDMGDFIRTLHEKEIYVIGRISVFQDPYMTKVYPERAVKSVSTGGVWKDYQGLSFIDVGASEHWKYIAELSRESYELGFDELNYDYIRYPSDGNMKDTLFTLSRGKSKPEILREFFEYLHKEMKPTGAVLSADLFGMTTTNDDDLNIGQVLENALPYFDYIAPMVYPSHYPPKWNGFANPNHFPYEVVRAALDGGVEKVKKFYGLLPPLPPPLTALPTSTPTTSESIPAWKEPSRGEVSKAINKLRPWLQDFDYGGNYGPAEVRAQIKATYDAGLNSWMLWAPSNRYTVEALEKN